MQIIKVKEFFFQYASCKTTKFDLQTEINGSQKTEVLLVIHFVNKLQITFLISWYAIQQEMVKTTLFPNKIICRYPIKVLLLYCLKNKLNCLSLNMATLLIKKQD